jgi:hypothetical protein
MLKTRQNNIVLPAAKDNATFRVRFDECLFQIPDGPGQCVIIAYKGGDSKVIDVVRCSPRLRKDVRSGNKKWDDAIITRYLWLRKKMRQEGYDQITFQIVDQW